MKCPLGSSDRSSCATAFWLQFAFLLIVGNEGMEPNAKTQTLDPENVGLRVEF